jgi:hypothetical protein
VLNFPRAQECYFPAQSLDQASIVLENRALSLICGEKEVTDLVKLGINSEFSLEPVEHFPAEQRELDINLGGELSPDPPDAFGRSALAHCVSFQEEDVLHAHFDQVIGDADADYPAPDNDNLSSIG